ncbi:transcription repressor OFP8-like [Oryza glaberrima]|uniref:Transcription repressor n=1 Tax=Oryza glaberrima TaxID=4538 RepID=I1P339_ORYGL|nr:transcription repressor OFP8-like [Oryza glaberrima]
MMSPGVSAKKRHASAGFTLRCGCKDAKSVSVSASAAGTPSTTATRRRSAGTNPSGSTTTDTLTMTSASSSFLWEHSVVEFDHDGGGGCGPESFSGLLRELSELEQSVASWGRKSHHQHHDKKHSPAPSSPLPPQEDRKEKNGGNGDATDKPGDCRDDGGGDGVGVALDGSVAVVKQSDDPLGDFRQSMLQMIVENGIVAGEDLREMLRRFLTLNAPHHHDVILRAFAEIWDGVFAATASLVHHHHPPPSSRREPVAPAARPPAPRTPPRHRHPSPRAWRV